MCAGIQKRLEELWEDPKLSVKCINLWSAVRGKLQWFILAEIGFLGPLLTTVTIIVAMFKAPASTSLLLSTKSITQGMALLLPTLMTILPVKLSARVPKYSFVSLSTQEEIQMIPKYPNFS